MYMVGSGKEIALRIETAYQDNRLSEAALDALNKVPSLPDLALGISTSELQSDELLLVTVMPDDSTSQNRIVKRRTAGSSYPSRRMLEGEVTGRVNYEVVEVDTTHPESNAEATRIGHNAVLTALAASSHPEQILFATRYLNGKLLNSYGPLEAAKKLDRYNFTPDSGTPLYDQTAALLKMVLAKYEQIRADWREARTATLVITDGHDQHSRIQTASSVAEVVKSMRSTGHHIVAAMGIDDGTTDFRQGFIEMGIDPKWILTPGSTQAEIQEAFGMFAKAASQATATEDFPRLLASGFGEITKT